MALNKIKIDADLTGFRESILKVSNELNTRLGKQGINILNQETTKFLKGEASAHIRNLDGEMKKLGKTADRYAQVLKNGHLSLDKQKQAAEKLRNTFKDINRLSASRGAGGGGGGGPGSVFNMGGGGGGSMGMMGKLAGGLGIGALLAAGGYAMNRARSSYQYYAGGINDRMALRARGITDPRATNDTLQAAGFGPRDVQQTRLGMVNAFGGQGGNMQNVTQMMQFARATGQDPSKLTEMGTGLRQQIGQRQAWESFSKIQAAAMASGIKEAIGPWLETSASMLTQLNESGLTLDEDFLGVFTFLTKGGAPVERTGQQILGLNQAIKGASGEAATFFTRAFAAEGIGGGTLGGAAAAMKSGGLFGISAEKARGMGMDKSTIQSLQNAGIIMPEGEGISSGFRSRMTGITRMMEARLPLSGTSGQVRENRLIARGGVLQQLGFGADPVSATATFERLQTAIAEGNQKEIDVIEREIRDRKNPQAAMVDRLEKVMDNTDGSTKALQAVDDTLKEQLGVKLVPVVNALHKVMINMNDAVVDIANRLVPDRQTKAKTGRASLLRGGKVLDEQGFLRQNLNDPENAIRFEKELETNLDKARERYSAKEILLSRAKLPQTRKALQESMAREMAIAEGLVINRDKLKDLQKSPQQRAFEEMKSREEFKKSLKEMTSLATQQVSALDTVDKNLKVGNKINNEGYTLLGKQKPLITLPLGNANTTDTP